MGLDICLFIEAVNLRRDKLAAEPGLVRCTSIFARPEGATVEEAKPGWA